MDILYRADRVYLWCAFASSPIVVLIRSMNTRRNVARILEEEVANAGALTYNEKVPPLEENVNVEQAPTSPPPMTEAEMRAIRAQMA